MARLQANVWVSAYIRRVNQSGAVAAVARRGDEASGTIFIKINTLGGAISLLGPAMPSLDDTMPQRRWELRQRAEDEADIDRYLAREGERDPDMWVVEIEDRSGKDHLLDEERAPDLGDGMRNLR
ncbi:MAG: DUF1491 family protein [Pseudomonadota bacterium]